MAYPFYGGYNYQPMFQPMQDQLQQLRNQPQQINQDDRIFVQGELSAQAYLVAPNSFVRLWDSTKNVYYEKRADASGRPFMESFKYEKILQNVQPETTEVINYDAKIKALEERIKALESMKGDVANVSKSDSNDTTV